jgi:ribosomal protein L18
MSRTAKHVLADITRRSITERVEAWEREKADLDKRLALALTYQAESDRLGALIAEAKLQTDAAEVVIDAEEVKVRT